MFRRGVKDLTREGEVNRHCTKDGSGELPDLVIELR